MAVLFRFVSSIALLACLGVCGTSAQTVSVIWSDSTTGQILRGTVGSGGVAEVLFAAADYPGTPAAVAPFGIATDESFIYWSDSQTGQILRGSVDGLGAATLLFESGDYPGSPAAIGPAGLAVDEAYVYWADNGTGQILRGNKDGSGGVTALFSAADYPGSPNDVYPWEVSVADGQIYWSDADTSQILRGAADGSSSVQALFTSAAERVNLGLAIEGDYIYWGDTENEELAGTLLRGSITGTGFPEILYDFDDYPGSEAAAVPAGIVARNGQLYWVDSFTRQLLTASADGSGSVSVLVDISNYPGSPTEIGPTFLAIFTTGYDADFDNDGDVDGRDFLVWQRGQSPAPFSAEDLALWQEQYGTTVPLATVQTVPEPSALISAIAVAMLVGAARRRS